MIEIDIILGSKYYLLGERHDLCVRHLSVNRSQICSWKMQTCQQDHGMDVQFDDGGENT
jgi:hypothetical protein